MPVELCNVKTVSMTTVTYMLFSRDLMALFILIFLPFKAGKLAWYNMLL